MSHGGGVGNKKDSAYALCQRRRGHGGVDEIVLIGQEFADYRFVSSKVVTPRTWD